MRERGNGKKKDYNLDEILILRRETDRQFVLHEREEAPLDETMTGQIFDFFGRYKQPFLTNRTDKNFRQFMPVMRYFDVQRIVTMIGIPVMEE